MLTSCRPITKAGGLAAAGIGLGTDGIGDVQKRFLHGLVGDPWGKAGAIGRAGRGKMIPPALEKPLHGFIPVHPRAIVPRIDCAGVPVAKEVRKFAGMGRTIKIRLIVGNRVAEIVDIGGRSANRHPGRGQTQIHGQHLVGFQANQRPHPIYIGFVQVQRPDVIGRKAKAGFELIRIALKTKRLLRIVERGEFVAIGADDEADLSGKMCIRDRCCIPAAIFKT